MWNLNDGKHCPLCLVFYVPVCQTLLVACVFLSHAKHWLPIKEPIPTQKSVFVSFCRSPQCKKEWIEVTGSQAEPAASERNRGFIFMQISLQIDE